MGSLYANRLGELEIFVRVVELGSFSAAAVASAMTPSAVSKLISRLEARLGARLLNRSSRQLQLTPEGSAFHARGLSILADMSEAERSASGGAIPRGRVRLNVNVPVGRHFLLPLLPEFLEQYPGIALEIVLTDTIADLLEERIDLAIRTGRLANSRLKSARLGGTRMVIVGSPSYLARHGVPNSPLDLEDHNKIGFTHMELREGWPLMEDGNRIRVRSPSSVRVSDGDTVRELALRGIGLARLAAFQVKDDLENGRLLPLLEDFSDGVVEDIHVVYLGHQERVPARVRAVLDFLKSNMRF